MLTRPYTNSTNLNLPKEYKSVSLNHFLLVDDSFYKRSLTLAYKAHLISQGYNSIEYMNQIEWKEDKRWDWIVFNDDQIKIINIDKQEKIKNK